MADAADSKSAGGNIVGVQVPPPAPAFARFWRDYGLACHSLLVPGQHH